MAYPVVHFRHPESIITQDGDVFVFYQERLYTGMTDLTVGSWTGPPGSNPQGSLTEGDRILVWSRLSYPSITDTLEESDAGAEPSPEGTWSPTVERGVVDDSAAEAGLRWVPWRNGTGLYPLYEVNNPSITYSISDNVLVMSWWTNFVEQVEDYNPKLIAQAVENTYKPDEENHWYRYVCVAKGSLHHVQRKGGKFTGLDDSEALGYDLVPVFDKPRILSSCQVGLNDDTNSGEVDVPVFDFVAWGSGGSGINICTVVEDFARSARVELSEDYNLPSSWDSGIVYAYKLGYGFKLSIGQTIMVANIVKADGTYKKWIIGNVPRWF
ncbi:MAG: hypothetical protein ACTSWQ_08860 [Candidatus Thorarchaeota archaeon]